jgi:2-polyprenyl-3-methyl-5-hydroxy-6-metoxy-1,4-benzoquinol methylase
MSVDHCVVCGESQLLRTATVLEKVYLLTCQECGTASTFPQPKSDELEQQYSETYYGRENVKFVAAIERVIYAISQRRARWINKKIGSPGKILEIGCGRGLLLKAMSQLGHECHGIERSKLAATRAQRTPGISVYAKPLEQCKLPEGYFDLVIFWHVLEHLENPADTLHRVAKLLRPGGLLIIEVPNLSSLQSRVFGKYWLHLDLERHLFHFSAGGLRTLLETYGFHQTSLHTFSWEQCPFGVLQSLLNWLGLPREALYKILKKEVSPPFAEKLFHFALAAAALGPATLFAMAECLLGRGGVLRVTAQRCKPTW